jgi:glyoxylase-like metal-dependent hydrolase (beta-lactamase superfamily II)
MEHNHQNRNIISPALTGILRLSPLIDYEYMPVSGATRLIDRHSSMYVIPINEEGNELMLIDAGMDKDALKLRSFLATRGLDLDAIKAVYISHAHSDHIGALHSLSNSTDVYISEIDSRVLAGKELSEGPVPKFMDRVTGRKFASAEQFTPNIISNGHVNKIGELTIRAFRMSGHTGGSYAFSVQRDDIPDVDHFVADAFDYKKDGSVIAPPLMVSADTYSAEQSIIDFIDHIDELNIKQDSLFLPAHSGKGTYRELLIYRDKYHQVV